MHRGPEQGKRSPRVLRHPRGWAEIRGLQGGRDQEHENGGGTEPVMERLDQFNDWCEDLLLRIGHILDRDYFPMFAVVALTVLFLISLAKVLVMVFGGGGGGFGFLMPLGRGVGSFLLIPLQSVSRGPGIPVSIIPHTVVRIGLTGDQTDRPGSPGDHVLTHRAISNPGTRSGIRSLVRSTSPTILKSSSSSLNPMYSVF